MEMTSLGQKALKGGTTLNKPPIGVHTPNSISYTYAC